MNDENWTYPTLCDKCGNLTYYDGECMRCGEGSPQQKRIRDLEQENAQLKAENAHYQREADAYEEITAAVIEDGRYDGDLSTVERVSLYIAENARLREIELAARSVDALHRHSKSPQILALRKALEGEDVRRYKHLPEIELAARRLRALWKEGQIKMADGADIAPYCEAWSALDAALKGQDE